MIFVLVRALTYATLFIGVVLVFMPARLIARSGMTRPQGLGLTEVAGALVVVIGAAVALWCVLTFALVGRGTPLPLDPPRRLVVRGPYKYVRNPMYLGAVTALAGAAAFYRSGPLALYAACFLLVVHAFVVWYEEPTLRATFGADYARYCRRVRRWRPKLAMNRSAMMSLVWALTMLALLPVSAVSAPADAAPPCEAAPRAAVPDGWTRKAVREKFSIALPPSCELDPEPRFVHGGTSWKCGTVGAQVVWGMWGASSFSESAKKCSAKVEGVKVMVVREQRAKGAEVEVLYRTGDVHEPLVAAWSERPEDQAAVEAIVFSGKR